jgi:hypothetical protein
MLTAAQTSAPRWKGAGLFRGHGRSTVPNDLGVFRFLVRVCGAEEGEATCDFGRATGSKMRRPPARPERAALGTIQKSKTSR